MNFHWVCIGFAEEINVRITYHLSPCQMGERKGTEKAKTNNKTISARQKQKGHGRTPEASSQIQGGGASFRSVTGSDVLPFQTQTITLLR